MNTASARNTSNWRTSRCVDVAHAVEEDANTTAAPMPARSEAGRAYLTESSCPMDWYTKNPTR